MSASATDRESSPRLPRVESILGDPSLEPKGIEYRAFGVAADDFSRHLAMLEVRKRTGDRFLFAYHLLGRVDWIPSSAMTLFFGDSTVVLVGRNLEPFFIAVRDQKASWVREADRTSADLASPATVVVESITVETRLAPR